MLLNSPVFKIGEVMAPLQSVNARFWVYLGDDDKLKTHSIFASISSYQTQFNRHTVGLGKSSATHRDSNKGKFSISGPLLSHNRKKFDCTLDVLLEWVDWKRSKGLVGIGTKQIFSFRITASSVLNVPHVSNRWLDETNYLGTWAEILFQA